MKDFPTLIERFFSYAKIDTEANDDAMTRPSTPGQLVLLRQLVRELHDLGLADAFLGDDGIVMATLPATAPMPKRGRMPVLGLVAHVDTTPEFTGKDVKPQTHRNYQGGDIIVNAEQGVVISAAENPHLTGYVGHDIITSDGTTLLGADDKAGIAAIMDLLTRLVADPSIPHPDIRVAFTPDEEIGKGVITFDVKAFGADAAYTIDGTGLGLIDNETFSADGAVITIKGRAIHPAIAYQRMVNATQVAATLIASWPQDQRPETTRDRDGFVYFYQLEAGCAEATLRALIRDFDDELLARRGHQLKALAAEVAAQFPGAIVDVSITPQYRNMRSVLRHHPHVVERAMQATRNAGIEPSLVAIRGGTDGSSLCYMGLPTPNIFNGCHNYHSPQEHVSAQVMVRTVDTLVELAKIWTDPIPE